MGKFANKLRMLKFMLSGRKIVGEDKFGNIYYTQVLNNKERRFVHHVDEDEALEVELPVEWVSWLQRVRVDPPTPELSEALDRERSERMRNAIEWDRQQEVIYQHELKKQLEQEKLGKNMPHRPKTTNLEENVGESIGNHLNATMDALKNRNRK